MRKFPDVLGMDLSAATVCLEAAGEQVRVTRTAPDRNGPTEGYEKVMKQERKGEEWLLTVGLVPDAYR